MPRTLQSETDLMEDPFKKYVTSVILVDSLEKRSSNVFSKFKRSSLVWLQVERLFKLFWRITFCGNIWYHLQIADKLETEELWANC